MNNINNFIKKILKEREIKIFLNSANDACVKLTKGKLEHLNVCDYKYTCDEAMHELDLDFELIHQLVEDYVIQIIKAKTEFLKYIKDLKESQKLNLQLDYRPLRELAHKNLGVVKNLRIKDAEKILTELMKSEDLDYLGLCLELLEVCAIRLKPACAYDTFKLIEVKSFL